MLGVNSQDKLDDLRRRISRRDEEAVVQVKIGNSILELIRGDITEQDTEAIVNAANCQLILGGGVAGAIRRKGGPVIQQECNKIGETFVGGAVKTTGGNLKAKYVIHAVGPRMGEGNEDNKLKSATLNSLKLAESDEMKSISFPAISTGVFGFPIRRCAEIMLGTITDYLKGKTSIEKVVFCLFTEADYKVFEGQLELALSEVEGKEIGNESDTS
jgi:O-acetyl-ADP-ribose deacetylase (regulator of RNase III)